MPFVHVAAGFWVDVFGCVNKQGPYVVVLPPEFRVTVMEA